MKPAILDQLIEKFYDGETSLEEEKQLREFFRKEDLPESLMGARAYFIATDGLSENTLSNSFDQNLADKLIEEKVKPKWIINAYWISGIAASILIFIAIWLGPEIIQPKEVYGTISDPEIAFAETKKVLNEVSQKMNKGMQPAKKTVGKVKESVEQVGEINKINNALKKTEKLNKLDEASDLLKSFSKVTIISGNS